MRVFKKFFYTIVFSIVFVIGLTIFIKAEENNYCNFNDYELYNETNTFDYNKDLKIKNDDTLGIQDSWIARARYDMSKKNGNIVDESPAKITVFTHGWSDSSWRFLQNWNGDLKGEMANKSFVAKMANLEESNVYSTVYDVKTNSKNEKQISFKVIDPFSNPESNEEIELDFSKNTIIVFDGFNTGYGNDYIYTQFNYMMSKVLLDVKNQNNGKLPKVNLIGHSRGGLTNLQYALDHPDLVDNMYSIGTPYFGSPWAKIDKECYEGDFSKAFLPEGYLGVQDFGNEELYTKYVERWNNHYEYLYSNIKVMALGSTTAISYLLSFCEKIPWWGYLIAALSIPAVRPTLNAIGLSILKKELPYAFVEFIDCVLSDFPGKRLSKTEEFKQSKLRNEGLDRLLKEIIKFFGVYDNSFCFKGDLVVDIDSQLGMGYIQKNGNLEFLEYKGFNRKSKLFGKNDYEGGDTHNQAPVNDEIQTIILNDYKTRICEKTTWEYNLLSNGTACINFYRGEKTQDGIDKSILNIPSTITDNGVTYTVSAIGDYAFNKSSYPVMEFGTLSQIETLNIPNTITSIGKSAFEGLSNIKEVNFEEDSKLKTIKESAFANTSISSINIPDSCTTIGDEAFYNSMLTTIEFSSKIDDLGSNVFGACKLENVYTKNNYISFEDGILIKDYGETLTYVDKNIKSLVLNEKIKTIDYCTFENSSIETIDLVNCENIYPLAFMNSKLEKVISANKLTDADDISFALTPLLENDQNGLIIGDVLLKQYLLDDDITLQDGIKRIGKDSLVGESKRITIPKSVTDISNGSFNNIVGLEEVYFSSYIAPNVSHSSFNEGTSLYVPEFAYKQYLNKECFKQYKNNIKIKNIEIICKDGDKEIKIPFAYGRCLKNLDTLQKDGYEFLGFEDALGNVYNVGDYLYFKDDIVLNIIYKEAFKITLSDINKDYVLQYGEQVEIEHEEKNGFIFKGYINEDGVVVIDENNVLIWGNISSTNTLTPSYEAIKYEITYFLNGAEVFGDLPYEFSAEDSEILYVENLPIVKSLGYEFQGWFENNNKNEYFLNTQNYFRNISLEAKFEGTIVDCYEKTIKEKVAIIELFREDSSITYNYTIAPSCKYFSIIGGKRNFYGTITISPRSDDITIGFEDFSLFAPDSINHGYNGIVCKSEVKIIIVFSGHVSIAGGTGANGQAGASRYGTANIDFDGYPGGKGGTGFNGGNGILGYIIELQSYSSKSNITINGGNGGQGGTGGTGQTGGRGKDGPSGWFLHHKKGDDGKTGGTGGDGGDGGKGGYAIYATKDIIISDASDVKLFGGDGGLGGIGGQGGTGGEGTSDESSNPFGGVGNPGDGGLGGTGGNAGNGGNGELATNHEDVKGKGGLGGKAGVAGQGGAGGIGGNAGAKGGNGKKGANGSYGARGAKGKTGEEAHSSSGSSESIVKIDDPFSRRFRSIIATLHPTSI